MRASLEHTAREQLKALIAHFPQITMSEASRAIGVSRQAIFRICQSEGLALKVASDRETASHRARVNHVQGDLMLSGIMAFEPAVPRYNAPDLVALVVTEQGHSAAIPLIVTSNPTRKCPENFALAVVDSHGSVVYDPPIIPVS